MCLEKNIRQAERMALNIILRVKGKNLFITYSSNLLLY